MLGSRPLSSVKNLGRYAAQICAFNGCEHAFVALKNGRLMAFGYNHRGQLGIGNTRIQAAPRLVKGLENKRITLISCSYFHSIVAVLETEVFTFGRNDFGQLGHGDTNDIAVPRSIQRLRGRNIVSLACGQYHTCVVSGDGVVRIIMIVN